VRAFRDRNPSGEVAVTDLLLDKQFMRLLGLDLGAGIVVYGEKPGTHNSMLAHAFNCLEFFESQSCGKCVPCRLGCQQLLHLTTHLRESDGANPGPIRTTVEQLGQLLELTSICGLGRSAPNPLMTVLEHFPDDLQAPTRKRS
jgi:NADH:ubiquinone oxidoreductase subunit F (NADH-binding)